MIYVVYFADEGTPKTGLSPTLVIFVKISDGASAGAPPSVSELSGGFYKFTYVPTEEVAIRVDSEDATMNDSDRYIPVVAGPHDDDLDATMSSRSSHSAAAVWIAANRTLSTPADYKADVSALALEDGGRVQNIETDTNEMQSKLPTNNIMGSSVKTDKDGEIDYLTAIEGGRWKIINNQMIFYKADNITEVARFNLLDKDGLPAEKNVMERTRV